MFTEYVNNRNNFPSIDTFRWSTDAKVVKYFSEDYFVQIPEERQCYFFSSTSKGWRRGRQKWIRWEGVRRIATIQNSHSQFDPFQKFNPIAKKCKPHHLLIKMANNFRQIIARSSLIEKCEIIFTSFVDSFEFLEGTLGNVPINEMMITMPQISQHNKFGLSVYGSSL